MKALTCAAARRRLEAFHDEELPISDQIAVGAHLEWCEACASTFADLGLMRAVIRGTAPGRVVLSRDEDASLRTTVVSGAKAEESMSFDARLRDMFQDMHFVYAGLAGLVAVVVCVGITLGTFGMTRAITERPETLAAMVKGLGLPGSNQNPMAAGSRVRMPRALDDRFSTAASMEGGDVVVALAVVVTREGRIASLELLRAQGTPWIAPGNDEATLVNEMLGAASEARFEPAIMAGSPVAVNVVWIVAHTTVRGTSSLPPPARARRRAADVNLPPAVA
jgi:hypothetical protein